MVVSLIALVRTLRSLVISRAEVFINKYLFRSDFLALLLGLTLTAMVQSSSVTTSLVIPLVGAGIVSINRCYPFTLGANVGTTITALLASLATVNIVDGHEMNTAGVTVAFAHLVFNISGILVFYPLKSIPIFLATRLADLAAESKKWAILFVLGVFFLLPLLVIIIAR
jgi:sodium-dependent phosphate cotransporter